MIVRLASVSLVALLATVAAAGCASNSSDDGTASDIGTSEAALSSDNDASQEAEDGAEEAEDGVSGATPTDPTPASGSVDAIDATIKTNPGKYFQPAGCIVSTRVGPGDWKHVFTNCTNPSGKRTFNGTIESVWTLPAGGGVQVVHTATDFSIKGPNVTATATGARTVNFTFAPPTVTKKRVGTWTGTITKNAAGSAGEAWTHNANFTTTWDATSKCYTRDGEVDNTIGDRAFGRTVSGYKVCGSLDSCPEAGEIVLDRKDGNVQITIDFLGNGNYDIEGAKKKKVLRKLLVCLVP